VAETAVSRLETAARATGGGGVRVIPYLMAGYPSAAESIELGRGYARAGAAVIEVGIPFSDPLADGPTIQLAGKVALERGMTVSGGLRVCAEVAGAGVPVVAMTYVNPVLAYDPRRFAADAAAAGVAGVIIPDLVVEEAAPVVEWLRAAGLDAVFMVAPTSSDARIQRICDASSGFVYCVTLTGVTGARAALDTRLGSLLARVRERTPLPLAAGFGISSAEHVRALRGQVDAVVIASRLLEDVHAGRDPLPLLAELVRACP
jgi:tryptophan synthase alpha chain